MLTIRRYRLKHVPTPFSGVSWKIKMRGTSILLVLSEIWMVFWERRERGFVANLKLPLRFAKYLACTALFLGAFGRGAFVVLMLFTWFRRVDDVIDGATSGGLVRKAIPRTKRQAVLFLGKRWNRPRAPQ